MAYRAFVSSTFEDLKKHRAHVIHALHGAGFSVDPMEHWTADSDEPKNFSQDRVKGCNLFVLLVAYRRGYVPAGEQLSITQLEYEAAVKLKIDILPFILQEDEPWIGKFNELDKDPEIRRWRAELLKHHGVKFFSFEPSSIELAGALVRWIAKKESDSDDHPVTLGIKWPDNKSPYPGLMWFNEEYASLFFGRDREIHASIAKMTETHGRFLLISGASGSGKSSLAGAGLWRALIKEDRLAGSRDWNWLRIQPGDGKTPFVSLAWGLRQAFPKITDRPDDLGKLLATDRNSLRDLSTEYLDRHRELLLFVDQMEELFTRGFENEDVRGFLELLATTARDKDCRVRVLATIRSEFLTRLEESEIILELLNTGYNYHLGPVSPKALQDMIEKPAQMTGYTFEPKELVDEILGDARQEPGQLPLVAYALNKLFDRREGQRFVQQAYQTIGKVAGAIGTQADQVIDGLNDREALGAFDRVFSELVHIERDGPPTPRRISLSRFNADSGAQKLIEALAAPDCRILVTDAGQNGRSLEVAHEKLFTAWRRLKDWIDKGGDDLRLIEHATEEAYRWHRRGERFNELWPADRVSEVVVALKRFGKTADADLDRFLAPHRAFTKKLEETTLSHEERALLGAQLREFGDSRPGVGLRTDGLPEIRWSDPIAPGKIKFEPSSMVVRKRFRLAIYTVTNIQFEAFVNEQDGYGNDKWWDGINRSQGPSSPDWKEANHPREKVSWYEAIAFCRWLTEKYRQRELLEKSREIRLPTEWEWQLAATAGDVKNQFPWGPDWDPLRCNSAEANLKRTTAVGLYPWGATMFGMLDMAGNVWEWCLNKAERPRSPNATTIDQSQEPRAMRGGAWITSPLALRSSYRFWNPPDVRTSVIGFRLAQDAE